MNPIQQAIANRNKKIVIGAGLILAGLWVLLVMYVIAESQKNYDIAQPGVVAVHPAAQGLTTAPVATYRPARPNSMYYPAVTKGIHSMTGAPKAGMSSTSMRLHQTSNASVQHIGSGTNGGGGIALTSGSRGNTSRGVNSSGITYAALAYSGVIYIPTPNNAVTEVGASRADDVSSHKMSVIKRYNEEGFPGYNPDPTPDEDEPETPVGDVAWLFLALLSAAYVYKKRIATKQLS